MAIEVGAKVSGKVSGITNFGAFVDLADNQTGLVHISQVSDHFIKDIHDVLAVGDDVTVKVVKIGDDGKIALSIKEAQPKETHQAPREFKAVKPSFTTPKKKRSNDDFNSMLASFMKESDSRLSTLKRQTDGKRGGRGGRRS